MQTYVYWRGDIADEIAGAICERARAGVRCNVILDALGAAQIKRPLIREMREAGARCPAPAAAEAVRGQAARRTAPTAGSSSPTARSG